MKCLQLLQKYLTTSFSSFCSRNQYIVLRIPNLLQNWYQHPTQFDPRSILKKTEKNVPWAKGSCFGPPTSPVSGFTSPSKSCLGLALKSGCITSSRSACSSNSPSPLSGAEAGALTLRSSSSKSFCSFRERVGGEGRLKRSPLERRKGVVERDRVKEIFGIEIIRDNILVEKKRREIFDGYGREIL